ncbi:hypothetical protein D3C80_1760590 [compost metagenome]
MPDGFHVPFLWIVACYGEQGQSHLDREMAEDIVVDRLRSCCIFGAGLEPVVYHRARNRTERCLFGHCRKYEIHKLMSANSRIP